MGIKNIFSRLCCKNRHARASGHPESTLLWIPACAGMTYMLILTAMIFSVVFLLNICGIFFEPTGAYAETVPLDKKEMGSFKEADKNMEKCFVNVSNLNSQLKDQAKMLYIKSQEARDMKYELSNTRDIIDGLNKERMELKNKNEVLQEKVNSLEKTGKQERAGFYQELGAAYGSAGNFEKAIEAYNRSLQCASDNTRIYYYLGLLYKQHLDDSRKAIYNFKKYLEYNPGAADKEEVEYLIKFMSE